MVGSINYKKLNFKKMKIYKLILPLLLAGFVFSSCDKSNDYHEQNAVATGLGSIPISNNALADFNTTPPRTLSTSSAVTSATGFAGNANINVELTYFSASPIQKIDFYTTVGTGAKTLVSSTPYAASFSAIKGVDTLMIPYNVPSSAVVNTVIRLDYEVVNVNALKVIRTAYIKRI
jgi:hypothetical protein